MVYNTTSISVVISTRGKFSITRCALIVVLSTSVRTTWNVWIGMVLEVGTRGGMEVDAPSILAKEGLGTARSRIAKERGLDRLIWSNKSCSEPARRRHDQRNTGDTHICVQRSPSANTHIPLPSAHNRFSPCGPGGTILRCCFHRSMTSRRETSLTVPVWRLDMKKRLERTLGDQRRFTRMQSG